MKYNTLFFSKIRKDVSIFVGAAVVIDALRGWEIFHDFLLTADIFRN